MSDSVVGAVIGLSLVGVIFRPFGVAEVWAALAGAVALVLLGQLAPGAALAGAARGADVYAFLSGMMLLSALAETEGVFAWAAARVLRAARGDAGRLFALLFAVAIVITVFLSNDATAVVLTPAVAAVVLKADVAEPLPYFLICAVVANAASFVLPISNPANLVVYGGALPALWPWLQRFFLPSIVAVGLTFATLWWTQRRRLRASVAAGIEGAPLTINGRLTCLGLGVTAALLMAASSAGLKLGPPTLAAACLTAILVLRGKWRPLVALGGRVSWRTLVLVAALFVMVTALDRLGLAAFLGAQLARGAALRPDLVAWATGVGLGLGVNLVNNLPGGLLAGHALTAAAGGTKAAAMVGIDLGPNLSVTGSLATILWLLALRRAGVEISGAMFLRIGAVVMLPALMLTEAVLVWG